MSCALCGKKRKTLPIYVDIPVQSPNEEDWGIHEILEFCAECQELYQKVSASWTVEAK